MRLVLFLLLLCAGSAAQERIEETFFLSTPNFLTGPHQEPKLRPVSVGTVEDGSVVLIGHAVGANLPTFSAVQPDWVSGRCTTLSGTFPCSDFYIARFLPDGQGPVYMTYLGGPDMERVDDFGVGPKGMAYILGSGSLDWMPITADLSEVNMAPDGSDPFLLTVSPSGAPDRFVSLPRTPSYSSIEIDASGAAYLAGTVFGGPGQNTAVVVKLPPSLDRIEYFSSYGGSEDDRGQDVAMDSSGRAYLAGQTRSADLPGTEGGFQSSVRGFASAFIARLSADGASVERATYVGGSGRDTASALALDPQGFIYVTGLTSDAKGFPLVNPARTAESPQPLNRDVAFLMKLDADLREVVYSTLLGATAPPVPVKQRLAADAGGRAHVLRQTGPVDPPAEGGGPFHGGSELFAVEEFSADGVPEEAIYFDGAAAMVLDAEDQIVVVGNSVDGVLPGRAVRLPLDIGDRGRRPPLHTAYLARGAPNRPAPYVEAIVNAASFRSGPASPGELVSLFGRDLGPESGTAFKPVDGRLPRDLDGTQVLIGETPVPLLFSGTGQVNAATPFSLVLGALVPIQVRRHGARSNLIWQTVAAADPGVFTLNSMRIGQAAVLNQDGTINSRANPAVPGSIVSIFATGGGKLTPPLEANQLAGLALSSVPQFVGVEFKSNGISEPLYAGSAPGLVAGVLQINAVVPEFPYKLAVVDVKITVGEVQSVPLQAFVAIAGTRP